MDCGKFLYAVMTSVYIERKNIKGRFRKNSESNNQDNDKKK